MAPVGSPSPAGLRNTFTMLPSSRDLACTGSLAPKQELLLLFMAAAVQQSRQCQTSLHCCASASSQLHVVSKSDSAEHSSPHKTESSAVTCCRTPDMPYFTIPKLHLQRGFGGAGPGPPTAAPAAQMPFALRRQASRRTARRSTSPAGRQTGPGHKAACFRGWASECCGKVACGLAVAHCSWRATASDTALGSRHRTCKGCAVVTSQRLASADLARCDVGEACCRAQSHVGQPA